MKSRKNATVYDWEFQNSPVQTTIKRSPQGLKRFTWHRALFSVWICLGIFMFAVAAFEYSDGYLYNGIIAAASTELAEFFGLEAETLSSLASQALVKGQLLLVISEVLLGGLFFLCAQYCRRIIARSKYIISLEQAALKESSVLLREEKREYEAAE